MPFIPHTADDLAAMLERLGASNLEDLFDEIPPELRSHGLPGVGEGIGEMRLMREMAGRAGADGTPLCFLGAGAYEHHVPAAVWQLVSRGEFYSSYTPYQAEASQGTLQLLYEYQTMMSRLTGLDVSNASLYDGASALAEAVLMAARIRHGVARRILVPQAVHPHYLDAVRTIARHQDIDIVVVPFDPATGRTPLPDSALADGAPLCALVVPQPNFFGAIEDANALSNWARERGGLVVGLVNPLAVSLLAPPGEWRGGADIAVGDGQPLGLPLAGGGPYFGFICCRREHVRQLPGRIVGATRDVDGRRGYTLTLQAREQHIRRAKATSNICTNQGLAVAAATIHMAILGGSGLRDTAAACRRAARRLADALCGLPGVARAFPEPAFHEVVVRLDRPAAPVLDRLLDHGIVGGLDLSRYFPSLGHAILACATETRTDEDIETYATALRTVLSGAT